MFQLNLYQQIRRLLASRRRVLDPRQLQVQVATLFYAEAFDRWGRLKWAVHGHNLVTTAGLNKLLDACFKTGLASPAWYVLLKGTGSAAAGDTLASHAGWSELSNYSGNRPSLTLGTIASGSVSNSASKASFSVTGSMDVYGAGVCDADTGTSGTLYGAGDFASNRSVISGDTLNVQVTLSVTAS